MRNVFSLYFDGAIFQTLHACISGGTVSIKHCRSYPYDELDDYLSTCPENDFVLCCNPALFQHDILVLPPAASKHYDQLVHSEVQKAHPELTSFSTFHSIVGLASIENKTYHKVAAFSYEDDALSGILAACNRHGKSVLRIYPAPYSIFRLAASACQSDAGQPRLFIASVPGEKLLLLGANFQLEFIRKIPSSGPALLAADIQSINMTLDYCLQSLRVKPVAALLLDQSATPPAQLPPLSVPLSTAAAPVPAGVPPEVVTQYLAPLAAALHFFASPAEGDILPAAYASFARSKKLLKASSRMLIAAALALALYSATKMMVISDLKSEIAQSRSALGRSGEELARYRRLDAQAKSLSFPLENLRQLRAAPPKAAGLASLTPPASQDYVFTAVSLNDAAGPLGVQIDGNIGSSGYGKIQATFERIIETIGKIPGYSISSSDLNIAQRTFSIKARYSARHG